MYEELVDALKSMASNSSAVGLDGISYLLLNKLPANCKVLLHKLYQMIWNNGTIPISWKQSVIVPVHKQGKCRTKIESYRPIALNSQCGKLLEKIILNRLLYYCDKESIIPKQQAGFRKGRCASDHLVKLSTCIKAQFARKKSLLATFFDIKSAYDNVWHEKLLMKLKTLGISGKMYYYIKSYLSDRSICTRVNHSYSSFKNVDCGIPQGSIIAPLLFSILIHDLPNFVSKNVQIVQYADDICIWLKTNIKKNTKKRVIDYVEKIYQIELNNIVKFMKENGFRLSCEKTHLMFFNNGKNPSSLPKLHIEGTNLDYKQNTKFLGVFFTTNLSWKHHINYLLTKARARLNFLKIIFYKPWCQHLKTLVNLTLSLIRSKLTYGQEVYHSAPKTLLKKLESLDSRALKTAIGLPIHTNTSKCYKELNILSLSEQRELFTTNYVVRSLSVENSVKEEIHLDSKIHFPKQTRNTSYLQPIQNYTSELFLKANIDVNSISPMPLFPLIPPWEHLSASYDINYSRHTKDENINILVSDAKQHLAENYPYHLKIYTDGSVNESGCCGAAFVIPALNIKRSFHLGKGLSIFTCELYAILFALDFINDCSMTFYNILLCVDSQSVLLALQSWENNARTDLVFEIRFKLHSIISKSILITFMWIPSHTGLYWNEVVDKLAKKGANIDVDTIKIQNVSHSKNEIKSIVKRTAKSHLKPKKPSIFNVQNNIGKLLLKLRLNSWKTKYCKDIKCICGNILDIDHVLFSCVKIIPLYQSNSIDITQYTNKEMLLESDMTIRIMEILLLSGVCSRL